MTSSASLWRGPGWLHWLSVGLVAALLAIGWFVFTGTGADYPAKRGIMAAHMAGGSLILLLTAIRIGLRIRRWVRGRAPNEAGNRSRLEIAIQWSLYLAVIAMVASGFATAILSGLNLAAFGGDASRLDPDWPDLPVLALHGWIGLTLLALAAMHATLSYRRLRDHNKNCRGKIPDIFCQD